MSRFTGVFLPFGGLALLLLVLAMSGCSYTLPTPAPTSTIVPSPSGAVISTATALPAKTAIPFQTVTNPSATSTLRPPATSTHVTAGATLQPTSTPGAPATLPLTVSPASPPVPAAPSPAFHLVAHYDLGGRQANGGLTIHGNCAYIGSRGGESSVSIVDIADPAHPRLLNKLPFLRGFDPREIRALPGLDILVIMTIGAATTQPGANGLHLFDIHDCANPRRTGMFDFQDRSPHEFYLWRDPVRPSRLLAYVAMFTAQDGLQVIDLSAPDHPVRLLTWNPPPPGGLLHSISLSPDGRRAYISDWSGGFLLVDTTSLAEAHGTPSPQLRVISHLSYGGETTHSAVPVPSRQLAILTDEIYSCPFGWLRTVDLSRETQPGVAGDYRLPENSDLVCGAGIFSSHNPLVFKDLVLASWYSGGLQAIDISDPAQPKPLAQFRAGQEQFWSYPIAKDGLIYIVSIEGGLYILSYTGPYAEEIKATLFAQGNANLCVI